MTAKNKRTKDANQVSKREAMKAEARRKVEQSKPVELTKPTGLLNRGQLISLIFLSMGISRLMQMGNAIRKETSLQVSSDANNLVPVLLPQVQATNACLVFFNGTGTSDVENSDEVVLWTPESTCIEDGFTTLLKWKFYMGWQVTAVVVALILQCWHSDEWLLRFTVGLTFTPIGLSVLGLLSVSDVIVKHSTVMSQVWLAAVLLFLGAPTSKEWIPFVGGRVLLPAAHMAQPHVVTKSLQSLVLMTLGLLFGYQAVVQTGLMPLLPQLLTLRSRTHASSFQVLQWINDQLLASGNLTQTPASLIPVFLLALDKLTLCFSNFFAWFYFPEQQQRTFLLYTGIIYFVTATYQNEWMNDTILQQASQQKMVDWTIAAFGILAWLLPSSIPRNSKAISNQKAE